MDVKPKYCCGNLEIDLAANTVRLSGKELFLTGIEYKLLSYLAANAGRVITPDQLLTQVWGEEYIGDNHLLQANMTRLRSKLQEDFKNPKYILTRIGVGYELLKEPN